MPSSKTFASKNEERTIVWYAENKAQATPVGRVCWGWGVSRIFAGTFPFLSSQKPLGGGGLGVFSRATASMLRLAIVAATATYGARFTSPAQTPSAAFSIR